MKVYTMIEGTRMSNDQEFEPSVVWIRSLDYITVRALPGHEPVARVYQQSLDEAYNEGFSAQEIWTYWRENGGDGYFSLRGGPVETEVRSIDEAFLAVQARLNE